MGHVAGGETRVRVRAYGVVGSHALLRETDVERESVCVFGVRIGRPACVSV